MHSAPVSSKSLIWGERRNINKQAQMFTFNFSLCVDLGNQGREEVRDRGLQCRRKSSPKACGGCQIESAFPLILLWLFFGPALFLLLFKPAIPLKRER